MNLVCRKSKIREKTDLGAWGRRQAEPGDWGRLSGCFSQIREIREKTDFRGGKGDLERERGGGGSDSTCIPVVSLYCTIEAGNTGYALSCRPVNYTCM